MQFPVLDLENIVQLNDKTRLSAIKSFISKDADEADEFTNLLIKPEASAAAIDVMDADRRERYLDWVYTDFTTDISSEFSTIYFKLNNTQYAAVVVDGTYTKSQFSVAIKTAMDLVSGSTFTVAIDENNKITISNASAFSLQGHISLNALLPNIGFKTETQTKTSQTGAVWEYCFKKITVTVSGPDITPDPTVSTSKTFFIKVISKEADLLFANDADLMGYEPDIMQWTVEGRASFNDVHRKVQNLILKYLEQNDFCLDDQTPITKYQIIDFNEINDWACFMALRLIFSGIHNDPDDVFEEKANEYEKYEIGARNKCIVRFDLNGDGKTDNREVLSMSSGTVLRR